MDETMELKTKRFLFLKTLYKESGGNEFASFQMSDIGEYLGFEISETRNIAHYLNGEGLTKFFGLGGEIAITHLGVVEVERVLSKPDESTNYFPPLNIININHMENSQIQQGNVNSSQVVNLSSDNKNIIKDFLDILKQRNAELNLSKDDLSELKAEIATIESQLESSKPKKTF